MIKTVLIDIDNTLLDFNESSKECIRQAFLEQGLPYTEKTFPTFKKINDGLWLKIEKGELDRQGLHKIRFNLVLDALGLSGDGLFIEKRFREVLFDTAIAVDGAREALEYLANKYKVYAASNAIYLQQINRLTKTDMIQYLSGLFISEKLGVSKPTKEFFDLCMAGANAKKQETIMIGDSISADIIGANEYGLRTIWYNHNKEENSKGYMADFIIDKIGDVKKIL